VTRRSGRAPLATAALVFAAHFLLTAVLPAHVRGRAAPSVARAYTRLAVAVRFAWFPAEWFWDAGVAREGLARAAMEVLNSVAWGAASGLAAAGLGRARSRAD
jgi:hypothetical protein